MEILQELLNKAKEHKGDHHDLRIDLASHGQHPKVAVLACSDSRVIPETIFGCGLGELFVIRTAGNTLGPNEEASFGYAAHHLGIKTFIVLGHTHCGAIASTIHGEHCCIFDEIAKSIKETKDEKEASILNAKSVANRLSALYPSVQVIPMLYDLEEGEVLLL